EYTFDFTTAQVIEEREFSVKGQNSVSFNLIVPQQGYFKSIIYDNTEYKKYSDKDLTHQTQSFFSLKTLNKILLLC
ncbi:MAG: hypothetical protein UIH41_09915, partial [Treponemataceae bacterium]|nr:hypothetical protein [Treponemataceae bacterium]